MAYCTNCGKETDWASESGYCRECTAQVPDEEKSPIWSKWWFWVIAGIIILNFVTIIVFPPVYTAEPAGYFNIDGTLKDEVAIDFKIIAQKTVKSYLKAPKTAEFESRYDKWYSYDEKDVFAFGGIVTAQNAFGVPLEDEYFVKFRYGGDAKTYEIRVVVIGDDVMYDAE